MAFDYPEHPNTNRRDPFCDEQGRNPFADGESLPEGEEPAPANPYAVSPQTQRGSYQPGEYEPNEQSRGRMLFLLAAAGCFASTLAAALLLAAMLISDLALGSLLLFAAGPLVLGGAACWSAWLMARHDLRAVRVGSMPGDDERRMRWAVRLGFVGSLAALLPLILGAASIVAAIVEELNG